jgi:hypothetical protein
MPFLFHDTAQTAFYVTIDALNRFQDMTPIGANAYVIPTIGLWFSATESYISTFYKLAQIDAHARGTTPRAAGVEAARSRSLLSHASAGSILNRRPANAPLTTTSSSYLGTRARRERRS